MSTSAINRYAIPHGDPLGARVFVAMKICELCGKLFPSADDRAKYPGDYVGMERALGRRLPLICKACDAEPTLLRLVYLEEETELMKDVAVSLARERARKLAQEFSEEKSRYVKRSSPLRHQSDKRTGERKRRFAKWREPLMAAFKEKSVLTPREIADVMGWGPSNRSAAVYYARNAGIPIVRLRYRMYGLSSNPELAPLLPPQDSETHRFMKEVEESRPPILSFPNVSSAVNSPGTASNLSA